jgi:hypothetical protein
MFLGTAEQRVEGFPECPFCDWPPNTDYNFGDSRALRMFTVIKEIQILKAIKKFDR